MSQERSVPFSSSQEMKDVSDIDKELAEAVSKLQAVSEHLVEKTFVADTSDNEDHTFSGILFYLEAAKKKPYKFVEIQGISVRGRLGLISIYATKPVFIDFAMASPNNYTSYLRDRQKWQRCFGPKHISPSPDTLFELQLEVPIRLSHVQDRTNRMAKN